MRPWMALAMVAPLALLAVVASCSSKNPNGLGVGAGDDDGGDATTSTPASDDGSGPVGMFSSDGGNTAQATDCKGGHYSGRFAGSYTSYLTSLFNLTPGIPLDVTGNVDLDLQQETMTTSGELSTTTLSIANGTISGYANNVFPYHCDMVGTLDCNTKKLVGGGLRNCWYCVGLFVSTDGGGCGVFGHFAGPLDATYDGKTFSFVNGTWNGSEQAALDDAGTLPEGGGVNDAGQYVGPGNYGGSGTWTAKYGYDN